MVNSADVGCCKPDPAVFGILLERLGRPAEEVAFLDDDLVNVAAAASLGLRAVHFQSTDTAIAALDAALGRGPSASDAQPHGGR